MRQNYRIDSQQSKKIARIKYAERQIEKYIKWCQRAAKMHLKVAVRKTSPQ